LDGVALRDEFTRFESREALEKHLRVVAASKTDVEAIARALRLPVLKSEPVEVLLDRIVDATVGYRLRSSAIRGE
jgi:hypothetical protein